MTTVTDEEARFGAALNRLHVRLGRENGDVARLEAYLARVPVEERPPEWEAHASSIRGQRDQAQAALDDVHRKMPASSKFGASILIQMLQARLRYWGRLDWLASVERLGGPPARKVLTRARELERLGVNDTIPEDCPVVRAMMVQDMNPQTFRKRPARRAGGGVNPMEGRGLERDTGAGT